MTSYIIRGVKKTESGVHEIKEASHSRLKAAWIQASYVEHGYTTTVEESPDEETPP